MANLQSPEEVSEFYHKIAEQHKIDLTIPARVVVARDTRASGARLLSCVIDGLKGAGVEYKDFGFLTTPQLHYLVRCFNTEGTPDAYGVPSEEGYYQKYGDAFKRALGGKKPSGALTVDCANGVGGPKLTQLIKYLPPAAEGLEIIVVNDDVIKPESLNVDVRCTCESVVAFTKPNLVRCGFREDQPAGSSIFEDRTQRSLLLLGWRRRSSCLLLQGREERLSTLRW